MIQPIAPVVGVKRQVTLRVFLSGRCNLRCKYCFVDKSGLGFAKPKLGNFKKAIDLFSQLGYQQKNIDITGGEPFLYFDRLKALCEYAFRVIPGLSISITTNATLISDKHLPFLRNNKIDLKLSIDGRKHDHDANRFYHLRPRVSTYPRILETINLLYRNNIKLKAVVVYGPETFKKLYSNVKYLQNIGFEQVDFYPDLFALWDNARLKGLNKELAKVFRIKGLGNSLVSAALSNNNTFKFENCNSFSVDPSGTFFSCDKVFSLPKSIRAKFACGSIATGINYGKKYNQLKKARNVGCLLMESSCGDCKYQKYCFCPIGIFIYTKNKGLDSAIYFKSFCEISKIYGKNIMRLVSREKNHEIK